MKTKLNIFAKRENYLLLTIALFGIFTASWHFKGAAFYKDINALRLEQIRLEKEEKKLLVTLQDREFFESEMELLKDQAERLDKLIPEPVKLPQALDGLETVLSNHSLQVDSLHIGESSFKEDRVEVNLTLKVTGRPFVLQSLLREIESLPNLVLFEKLQWLNNQETDPTLELHLKKVFNSN